MSKDSNSNNILKPATMALAGLSSNEDLNYQLKKSLNEVGRLSDLKEEMEQRCKRLDQQVAELHDDKQSLMQELETVRARLSDKEDLARSESTGDMAKQIKLQQQLDATLEELYKLETEKERFRAQYETAKAEQARLIEQVIIIMIYIKG
jgi:chromosome segregation ATPase